MKSCCAATLGITFVLMVTPAIAGFTIVEIQKDSRAAKDLGFTLTWSANELPSELHGTTTFSFQAPRMGKLQSFTRAILRIVEDDKILARIPLEVGTGRAEEIQFHFQLTPDLARQSYIDLISPDQGTPNGVIDRIELSTFLDKPE